MKEVQITAAYSHDEQLKNLYETAFPENEQIPWADLMRLIDQMSLDSSFACAQLAVVEE